MNLSPRLGRVLYFGVWYQAVPVNSFPWLWQMLDSTEGRNIHLGSRFQRTLSVATRPCAQQHSIMMVGKDRLHGGPKTEETNADAQLACFFFHFPHMGLDTIGWSCQDLPFSSSSLKLSSQIYPEPMPHLSPKWSEIQSRWQWGWPSQKVKQKMRKS